MNRILFFTFIGLSIMAILACSDNAIMGSSDDPNAASAEKNQSNSSDSRLSSSLVEESSSSFTELSPESSSSFISHVLCKVSGDWGYNGCTMKYPSGNGDLWSKGAKKVKTNIYANDSMEFGNRFGEFFFETDSIEGGKTQIFWNEGKMNSQENYFGNGFLSANVQLVKGNLAVDPYFKLGFYIAGFDSNGVELSADISNWNGMCFLYQGSIAPILQLDLGSSLNQMLGNTLPSATLKSSESPQCFEWKEFKHEKISGDEAAKHVAKIVFHFQAQPNEEFDGYEIFEIIAIGTNRDE